MLIKPKKSASRRPSHGWQRPSQTPGHPARSQRPATKKGTENGTEKGTEMPALAPRAKKGHVRLVMMLVLISVSAIASVNYFFGNPYASVCGDDCASMYSTTAIILGALIVFFGVIGLAVIVGILLTLVRNRRHDGALDTLLSSSEQQPLDQGRTKNDPPSP